ncbi:MAG: tRNA epoxyqueuosine(34) reductase QueG [Acidimicrobiales bacterium]
MSASAREADISRHAPARLTATVLSALEGAGIDSCGVAAVEIFHSTRRDLEDRKAAGLHGEMSFTYRNPSRSTDPARILQGARRLVVGAHSYVRPEGAGDGAPSPVARGRIARYARYDAYSELRAALGAGVMALREAGYRAVVVSDDNALVDREAAFRAGIGWYGRNTNLLLPGRGSWFVLGAILTDAPLTCSTPVPFGCGSCTRCMQGCPTGAIVAPGVLDARRCLAWLLQAPGPIPWEFRVALGDRIYGCDDCQEVCPPNIAIGKRSSVVGDRAPRPTTIDVAQFLDDDDAAVLASAGRWYVQQRQARFLRRNALVVLGNTADPTDPRTAQLVRRWLHTSDPLVRGHAVWAAARLGHPEWTDELASTEQDPMVGAELDLRHKVPPRLHA